jgi:hypothetical protein
VPIKQAERSAIGGGRMGSWYRRRWRLDIEADRVREESMKRSLAGSPKQTGRITYNDTTKRVILAGGWGHRRKRYAGGTFG